ncbi:MAG TPA: hypothetical protein ENK75_03485, partial [Saprospiraceae bacterium]|nr:hypothetical protein [Saprospiraceae bacterium]
MKVVLFISSLFLLFSCYPTSTQGNLPANAKKNINQSINQWHKDAAKANFDAYFNRMVDSAVFIGTDAKEVWSKKEFMHFSKPYFDQKNSWNFKPLSRNVYIDSIKSIAWFDDLLVNWMGICRGSGVVVLQ